jgi:hypothetical protein
MNTFADVVMEAELRQKSFRAEAEEQRWVRQAAEARAGEQPWDGLRRSAVRLGDIVAGLRCQLRSRFATELDPAAC